MFHGMQGTAMGVRVTAALGIAAMSSSMASCGGRGQKVEMVYPVSGMVRVGGQPLVDGMVSFTPASGGGGNSVVIVQSGTFACSVAAGMKLVRIDDMLTGKSYGGADNSLTAQVEPNADNHFEFNVMSRSSK